MSTARWRLRPFAFSPASHPRLSAPSEKSISESAASRYASANPSRISLGCDSSRHSRADRHGLVASRTSQNQSGTGPNPAHPPWPTLNNLCRNRKREPEADHDLTDRTNSGPHNPERLLVLSQALTAARYPRIGDDRGNAAPKRGAAVGFCVRAPGTSEGGRDQLPLVGVRGATARSEYMIGRQVSLKGNR